jgi:hypothetical protein
MTVVFSPQGTGACAICKKAKHCSIKNRIAGEMEPVETRSSNPMELVIYVCPYFVETS